MLRQTGDPPLSFRPASMSIAATPPTPYYAVIFTSLRTGQHGGSGPGAQHDGGAADDGYGAMAAIMAESAARQRGYLGVESAREDVGITVSYWASLADIAAWKQDSEHLLAQRLGRSGWYEAYKVRVCLVERDYGFKRGEPDAAGSSPRAGQY